MRGPLANPYGYHAADILARAPLVDLVTGPAGSFALPLTHAHRRLGTGHEPALTLIVEAEGFQPWHEPLSFGLAGFEGTRAVLRRVTEADVHEVRVEDPPAGALLSVRRVDSLPAHDEARVLAVPADGVVRLHAPLLPTPCLLDDWRQTRALGHDVQLWAPGRSSAPSTLDPRTRRLHCTAADTTTRILRVRVGGEDAAGVRALYACPDGERRWFASPDAYVREDPCLRLLAVTARGAATAVPDTGSLAPVELAAAAAGRAALVVGLRGAEGPPARLAAWLVPLEHWPHPARARALPARAARAVAVRGDTLVLEVADWQQHALVVAAAGCTPLALPPLSSAEIPARVELSLASLYEESLLAVDGAGTPIAGADVLLPIAWLALSPRSVRLLATDGVGACRLPPLPRGRHEALCIGDAGLARFPIELGAGGATTGMGLADPRQAAKAGSTMVTLEGRPLRARVRTLDGEPAAFTAFTIESETARGDRRVRKGFTDAYGRVLAAYVGEQATVHCRGVRMPQQATPGTDAAVAELDVPSQRLVGVELPAGARVTRATFSTGSDVWHQTVDLVTDRLLLGWRNDCTRCDVFLTEGPPATVLAADLPAGSDPVAFLARASIVRTVPLHAFAAGSPVHGFEVRPARVGRVLVYDQREGSPLRDGVWTARDRAAHDLRVFHPEHLPSEILRVPPGQGAHDPALVLELVRGTPVRFRIPSRSLPPVGQDVRITIHDGGQPRFEVALRSPGPGDPAGNLGAGDKVELRLPFALAPGHYAADVRSGRDGHRFAFVAGDRGEVVVE